MFQFSVQEMRVIVMGAARSGKAAAELLAARGARVTLTEMQSRIDDAERLRAAGVALELGEHSEAAFAQADLIVVSPGVPTDHPRLAAARARGVPIIGEIELASRWLKGTLIAVTGTKGKSTTTTLIGRLLEAAGLRVLVGGNIGKPLSAQVDDSTADTFHVVEVSSFQLETIDTFHPAIAVFLNFSPDHLDRHSSVEEYADAKSRIFENQGVNDWAVVNADDQEVLAMARRGHAQRLLFATERPVVHGVEATGDAIVRKTAAGIERLVPLSSVRLLGRHLLQDVVAATAVGSLLKVPPAVMTGGIESFTGLEHALEPVGEIGGVRFVNDSKATNVDAALNAIKSFDQGLVVIMGGRFKGGDLSLLRAPLQARKAAVVAIGEARPLMREAFEGAVRLSEADTMADAVRAAFSAAASGGTVLLAPACASFDMFNDYAERGRAFKEEVVRLKAEKGS